MFALVTLTVGGVNATSLLLVMVAPVLWFAHATFVATRGHVPTGPGGRRRITFLTLITSLWWMIGLSMQGKYGIPILRYTETYYTVAGAALSIELIRGLGYWFFYGRDALGAWTKSSVALVESLPFLALSYLLPIIAFGAGLVTRFRHRGFFALIAVIGLVISVGSHPWDDPSPYGAAFKAAHRIECGARLPILASGGAPDRARARRVPRAPPSPPSACGGRNSTSWRPGSCWRSSVSTRWRCSAVNSWTATSSVTRTCRSTGSTRPTR